MTDRWLTRVVLSGNTDVVADFFERLSPRFARQIGPPVVGDNPIDLWAALELSMRRFDARVAGEARHPSYLSIGSTIHDWMELEYQMQTVHHGCYRDKRFARRYKAMYRSLGIRHAQRNYDVIVHFADSSMPTSLMRAFQESGRPVIYHDPLHPLQDLLNSLERTAHVDRRTRG